MGSGALGDFVILLPGIRTKGIPDLLIILLGQKAARTSQIKTEPPRKEVVRSGPVFMKLLN